LPVKDSSFVRKLKKSKSNSAMLADDGELELCWFTPAIPLPSVRRVEDKMYVNLDKPSDTIDFKTTKQIRKNNLLIELILY
jgi:hypothetical protein